MIVLVSFCNYIITVELATQMLCMNEYVSFHHALVSHV